MIVRFKLRDSSWIYRSRTRKDLCFIRSYLIHKGWVYFDTLDSEAETYIVISKESENLNFHIDDIGKRGVTDSKIIQLLGF